MMEGRGRRDTVALSAFVLPLMLLLAQSPGDGWALSQAPAREVKRLYWELNQTTEIWVRLIPESPDGKPPLVSLVFQALFFGPADRDPYTGLPKWPKGEPARLAVRAQPLPLTMIRELSLRFAIDGKTLDLTRPGSRYRISRVLSTARTAPRMPSKPSWSRLSCGR
jgi:hypothetical protein